MQVKKQQLELDMEQQIGSKSGKEYIKAVYCHTLFNLYAEYIMRHAGLDEAQAEIKTARRNINDLRYADALCEAFLCLECFSSSGSFFTLWNNSRLP